MDMEDRVAKARIRLEAEERRQQIVDAARMEFAEHGFTATSLKDIAKAADISTGLIYAYFESKEALYDAVQEFRLGILDPTKAAMMALGPGPEALALGVFDLFKLILSNHPARVDWTTAFEKLLCRSLLSDGEFAHRHFKSVDKFLINDFVLACFEAGERSKEIARVAIPIADRMHFAHQLAMALNFAHMSGKSSFEYDEPKWQLVENAVLFCLRGIGFTEEAIAKYYQPERLRAIVQQLHGATKVAEGTEVGSGEAKGRVSSQL